MALHSHVNFECPACGVPFVPFEEDAVCPACGEPADVAMPDFVDFAAKSAAYNFEFDRTFLPAKWENLSLGDNYLYLLFTALEEADLSTADLDAEAERLAAEIDFGDYDFLGDEFAEFFRQVFPRVRRYIQAHSRPADD